MAARGALSGLQKAFAGRRLRLTPDAVAHQRQRVADDGLAVDRL